MMSWLIDGQQRVITLSRCMSGDEGIDVVFHPEDEEFQTANAATERDPNWFHLSHIWDDEMYRRIRRDLPAGAKGEKREARFERVRRILDYEIPAVKMVDHSFEDAVEAFTRINTLGVKLKMEDIESAKAAARHTGFIADEVAPFLAEIRRQGFSRMNVMHLFRACAFVAHPDGRNRTPLHELDRDEVQAAWGKTKRATNEAIELVRCELGLVNMDILWSGALLVPAIALCATTGPRERDSQGIAGWLAMAALLHRYSKSTETHLTRIFARAGRQTLSVHFSRMFAATKAISWLPPKTSPERLQTRADFSECTLRATTEKSKTCSPGGGYSFKTRSIDITFCQRLSSPSANGQCRLHRQHRLYQ